MEEIKITGLAELLAKLNELPVKVERNVLRGMVRAASKPVADEARALAPRLASPDPRRVPGALAVSVRVMSTRARGGVVNGGVVAGSNKKTMNSAADAFYAHFVEYGTAHSPAQPFLRPAGATKAEAATSTAAEYVRDRLESALK